MLEVLSTDATVEIANDAVRVSDGEKEVILAERLDRGWAVRNVFLLWRGTDDGGTADGEAIASVRRAIEDALSRLADGVSVRVRSPVISVGIGDAKFGVVPMAFSSGVALGKPLWKPDGWFPGSASRSAVVEASGDGFAAALPGGSVAFPRHSDHVIVSPPSVCEGLVVASMVYGSLSDYTAEALSGDLEPTEAALMYSGRYLASVCDASVIVGYNPSGAEPRLGPTAQVPPLYPPSVTMDTSSAISALRDGRLPRRWGEAAAILAALLESADVIAIGEGWFAVAVGGDVAVFGQSGEALVSGSIDPEQLVKDTGIPGDAVGVVTLLA